MSPNKVILDNVRNLCSMWQKVAQIHGDLTIDDHLTRAIVPESHWPNRVWFNDYKYESAQIELLTEVLKESSTPLIFPNFIFEEDVDRSYSELESRLSLAFEQIGMNLHISEAISIEKLGDIELRRIHSEAEAKEWADVFYVAFNYYVHPKIVVKNYDNLFYYNVYQEGKIIATALVYEAEDVFGIHSIGVHPSKRKKGIATEIMKILIQSAFQKGIKDISLQASVMGLPIYEKLGFKACFRIMNYILKD